MKKLFSLYSTLLFFSSLLSTTLLQASNYGYIKYEVPVVNKNHTSEVYLNMNSKNAARFSHSFKKNKKNSWSYFSLSRSYLSQGKFSKITASYKHLDKGCKFKFKLYYSKSPEGPWFYLGSVNAPTQDKFIKVPIGLCGDELCSSDKFIQRDIDKAKPPKDLNLDKKFEEGLAKDKAGQDITLNVYENKDEKIIQESLPLEEKKELSKREIQDMFEDFLSWEEHLERESRLSVSEEKAEKIKESTYLNKIQSRKKLADKLLDTNTFLGAFAGSILSAQASMDELIQADKEFLSDERLDFISEDNQTYVDTKKQNLEDLKYFRKNILSGSILKEPIETVARFSPGIGDFMDSCELLTG